MKGVFILLFAVVSMSCGEPLVGGSVTGLSGLLPGGLLSGGGGPADVLAKAKDIGSLTKGGQILNLGSILGLNSETECIRLCPKKISDTSLKCVTTTSFEGFPVCYQKNTLNKWVWPCVNPKKKEKKPKKKGGH